MKLKIPFVKQLHGNDCGIACVKMIGKFYGYNFSERKILDVVELHSDGVLAGELANYLLEEGFEVEIHSFDLNLFDPKLQKLSGLKLFKKVKDTVYFGKNVWKSVGLKAIIKFIEMGGKIKIIPPKEKTLIDFLKKKMPLIICLKSGILYDKKTLMGHYLVLNGYNKNSFIVNDPYYKGEYAIKKDKLMFALQAHSIDSTAYLIKAKPKKHFSPQNKLLIEEIEW